MPPRPFPFPMRIGNDLCNIPRIRKLITGKDGSKSKPLEALLSKILTYPERTYFHNRFGRRDYDLDLAAQFLAGRFAAKEACRKACDHLDKNTRGFKHIIILPVTELDRTEHQSRRPEALVLWEALKDPERSTAAQESLNVQTLEGQLCEISISHDGDYASAVALVPGMKQNQLLSQTSQKKSQR